ncbi:MAG: RDD family protein [Cyanophyceae cyanobacterium]
MATQRSLPERPPQVPAEKRAGAFLLDFITVWLLSSFVSAGLVRGLIFIVAWFGLRTILVESNQGQSLGRWAFNMKVVDVRFNKVPGLLPLAKREGVVGLAALLAMTGLNIAFINPLSMLILVLPLLADCGIAFTDELNQAFHDRLADTMVIPARRGFFLDFKLKQLWNQLKYSLSKRTK